LESKGFSPELKFSPKPGIYGVGSLIAANLIKRKKILNLLSFGIKFEGFIKKH